MATKQIQLRGISRTPSDRMTNDGGCAESLNVQLDNTELAPSFCPEDVTTKRGLPENLEAKKIFIHKTGKIENYIVVQSDKIVAYTPDIEDDEPLKLLDLKEGEEVNDIVSVGNTIVVVTTRDINYVLFKELKYKYLGNAVVFPKIKCWSQISTKDGTRKFQPVGEGIWFEKLPTEQVWNTLYNEETLSDGLLEVKEKIENFHVQLWQRIDQYINKGCIVGQAVLRYAVELYDGSLLSSLPLVIGASAAEPIKVQINVSTGYLNSSQGNSITSTDNEIIVTWSTFAAYAKLESPLEELLEWKDVIRRIKLYVSIPTGRSYSKEVSKMMNREEERTPTGEYTYKVTSTANLLLGSKKQAEQPGRFVLENTALTHLVANIDIEGGVNYKKEGEPYSLQDLIDGCSLNEVFKLEDEDIAGGEILNKDDMQHYPKSAAKIGVFNNAFILCGNKKVLSYDYNNLCSLIKENTSQKEYSVSYYIKTNEGEKIINTGPFVYSEEVPYAFQFFPDIRADKMIMHMKDVESGEVYHAPFGMYPHPFLNCAYAYCGLGEKISNYIDELGELSILSKNIETEVGKLLISKTDNPFIFPKESIYTFQSNVLGVAVATTALSQGQFGQFPLYVFTEDGIWAMETGADGSFISQKPLSLEVCINPDSITSFDNAVVFVTAQGVMLLQGSQVTNISPYMNGRHYQIEDSVEILMAAQKDFKDFIPIVDDETHFLAFVKEAKIAYDYAGKRLIFIKEGEDYQYIYKLDTKTWHKSAYGMKLADPINSYPECLVRSEEKNVRQILWVEYHTWEDGEDYLIDYFRDNYFPSLSREEVFEFLNEDRGIDVTDLKQEVREELVVDLSEHAISSFYREEEKVISKIYDLSTILDAAESKTPTKGVIVTRSLNLDEPDVFKTITDIRIRGQYRKGAVKFILLGSNDGDKYQIISTLRGKAWKLFRIIILADLQPTERISYIDVQYETKFANRLR